MTRRLVAVAVLVAACATSLGFDPDTPWTTDDGEPTDVVETYRASGCGWDDVVLLELRWPLQPAEGEETEIRQYVRDPNARVPAERLVAPYDPASSLTGEEAYLGLRSGDVRLWAGPDAERWVYLEAGRVVEAWPRVEPPLDCR